CTIFFLVLLFIYSYHSLRYLHSFPTRRSSDLVLLVCASFYYLSVGAVTISFYEIISAIQHRWLQQPLSIEQQVILELRLPRLLLDRKSTRLNSSHVSISYAVFCLKKKNLHTY